MTGEIIVAVKVLPHGEGLAFPHYASAFAAGCDLAAAVPTHAPLTLMPGARALVATGLAIALPAGFEAQVRPRSGLAFKHGVTVLNAPGTIDADYRGEVQVLLINLGREPFSIERGMRIAQLVVAPVAQVRFEIATDLEGTARGAGGFGSTGLGSTGPGSTGLGSTGLGSTGLGSTGLGSTGLGSTGLGSTGLAAKP